MEYNNGDILDLTKSREVWEAYYEEKITKGHINKPEQNLLRRFIDSETFLQVYEAAVPGSFPTPSVTTINKRNGKKRTVFVFPYEYNTYLKLLAWLLHRYDDIFSPSLYSFRKNCSAGDAVRRLSKDARSRNSYSYKTDIHNYFNSVPVKKILPLLRDVLTGQDKTYEFLEGILKLREDAGIMAGVPTSSFMANLYLSELDKKMDAEGFLYARYSDDIIVFAETKERLDHAERIIHDYLDAAGLTVNPSKDERSAPGEGFNYLGINCINGICDLSDVTVMKLKSKARRKARALNRWKDKKEVDPENAVKAFTRFLDRKLTNNTADHELTWCRYYLPVINTDVRLKELDAYLVACARSIYAGGHNKRGYRLSYDRLRELGYKSLVGMYYNPHP